MAKQFNVGVIGYGMSAKIFQIPFILPNPALKLYAIVQRHPKPDDDAEKDHPGIKAYRSAEDLVADPAVDLVVITTTPDTHVPLAKLALEAGKHVVCEKPFTPTAKEADELSHLAKKHQKLLTVFQNRRLDADYCTLREIMSKGLLGRIVEFETHFDRHRPYVPAAATWKTKAIPGGGAVYDLGTHLIDQIVNAFGLPERVTGFVGSQRQGDTGGYDDSCTVLLHYKDGLLATVKAGVVSPEVEQLRFWVRGEKGSFRKFHLDAQEDQLKAGLRPGDKGYALEPESHFGTLTTVEGDGFKRVTYPTVQPATYVEYYRRVAEALQAGSYEEAREKLPVKPEEARDVIRLIELAKQSSKEGRTLAV